MKNIVTGGAGFIGSNLVNRLISIGQDVIVIDNESAIVHNHFYYNPRATYYKLDICDYEKTKDLYKGIDYVYHLAAKSRIQPTILAPLPTILTNAYGIAVVLQCAKEAGVRKVISSSTSSIYGFKNTPPFKESMPDDCLHPYAVSKLAGEKICKLYNDLYDLPTITLRYFNVYGEHEPLKGMYAPIIGLFLRQHKAGEPLTIVPDGNQRRDFTYVQDVVEANIKASTSKARGMTINIGTGTNISILELAQAISPNIKMIEPRTGEARETLADITLAKELLNWEPKHKVLDYVKRKLEI